MNYWLILHDELLWFWNNSSLNLSIFSWVNQRRIGESSQKRPWYLNYKRSWATIRRVSLRCMCTRTKFQQNWRWASKENLNTDTWHKMTHDMTIAQDWTEAMYLKEYKKIIEKLTHHKQYVRLHRKIVSNVPQNITINQKSPTKPLNFRLNKPLNSRK